MGTRVGDDGATNQVRTSEGNYRFFPLFFSLFFLWLFCCCCVFCFFVCFCFVLFWWKEGVFWPQQACHLSLRGFIIEQCPELMMYSITSGIWLLMLVMLAFRRLREEKSPEFQSVALCLLQCPFHLGLTCRKLGQGPALGVLETPQASESYLLEDLRTFG